MESRLLFVTMTVNGTAGADLISLSVSGGTVTATVNSVAQSQPDTTVTDVTINGLGGSDAIQIISTGANPVTVNGGFGLDTFTLGATSGFDLDQIDATVTFNGGEDEDVLDVRDVNETGAVNFTLSGATVTRTGVPACSYSQCESLFIDAGNGANHFNVNSTAAGTNSLTLTGSGGDDVFVIRSPTTTVHVSGGANGASGDRIDVIGTATSVGSLRLGTNRTAGTFTLGSRTVTVTGTEFSSANTFGTFAVTTSRDADTLSISASSLAENYLTGTSGGVWVLPLRFRNVNRFELNLALNDTATSTDSLTVDHSGLVGAATLRLEAGIGTNTATLNGGRVALDTNRGAASGRNLDVVVNGAVATFAAAQNLRGLRLNSGGELNFNGSGTVLTVQNFSVGTGSGTLRLEAPQSANVQATFGINGGAQLVQQGPGTLNIYGTQSHGLFSSLSVTDGLLNMHRDAGSTAARRLFLSSSGITNFFASQHLAGLSVLAGTTTMAGAGNRVIVTSSLNVAATGAALDLTDNDMIIDYISDSPFEALRARLASGYNGGGWNGGGIRSYSAALAGNTALGFAEATDTFASPATATFADEPIDETCILVKYTFYGDANLDGDVDFSDYNRLLSRLGYAERRWSFGDLDFSGFVDERDQALLEANMGLSGL